MKLLLNILRDVSDSNPANYQKIRRMLVSASAGIVSVSMAMVSLAEEW